jgi:hypothetical protein
MKVSWTGWKIFLLAKVVDHPPKRHQVVAEVHMHEVLHHVAHLIKRLVGKAMENMLLQQEHVMSWANL